MPQNFYRLLLLGLILAAIAAFYLFDIGSYFSFADLKARHAALTAAYRESPVIILMAYIGIYILIAALSLPGAAIMTLAAGALFGLGVGSIAAVVGSTLGAACAFLIVRYLAHDLVQRRFGRQLAVINDGIRRDGAVYLLTLRLVPIFPFFIINIVMALTPIRVTTFTLTSLIGMIPAAVVFVNAGTELSRISSPGDILSPRLLFALSLLGLFPILARGLVKLVQRLRR